MVFVQICVDNLSCLKMMESRHYSWMGIDVEAVVDNLASETLIRSNRNKIQARSSFSNASYAWDPWES
jgi:hypothetical protein